MILNKLLDKLNKFGIVDVINQESKPKTKKDEYKPNKTILGFNNILTNNKLLIRLLLIIGAVLFILSIIGINSIYSLRNLFGYKPFNILHTLPFYFLSIIVITICLSFSYYKIKINFNELNIGQKGSDRLMTTDEIKETYLEIDEKYTQFDGIGGIPVARIENKLYIDNRINNNFIVALTRGGKGEIMAIPTIDILSRAKIQSSMIINDIKDGELSRASVPHLLNRGYEVKILNFTDYTKSNHLNLLDMAVNYYKQGYISLAQQVCQTIAFSLYDNPNAIDRFWIDSPIALFSAIALAHIIDCVKLGQEHKINMRSITLFISSLASITDEKHLNSALDDYFNKRDFDDTAKILYSTIKFSKENTRASLLSVTFSKLEMFNYDDVVNITTDSDINLEDIGFGNKPTALFIRLPQNNKKYYSIVSMIFSLAYFVLTTKAQREPLPNENRKIGECKIPVKIIGDEIFNGANIEDLHIKLSMCLSAKISFDLYAQSLEQVEAVYGGKVAPIIMDNCSTKVFIASDSEKTRNYFSEKTGQKTIKNISRNGRRFEFNKSLTESFESEPVIKPSRLALLKEGEILICQTLKRRTLKNEDILSRPILTENDLRLEYRYNYLSEFDPKKPLPNLNYGKPLTNLINYIYIPEEYTEKVFKEKIEKLPANIKYTIKNKLANKNIYIDMSLIDTAQQAKSLINSLLEGNEINYCDVQHIIELLDEEIKKRGD